MATGRDGKINQWRQIVNERTDKDHYLCFGLQSGIEMPTNRLGKDCKLVTMQYKPAERYGIHQVAAHAAVSADGNQNVTER